MEVQFKKVGVAKRVSKSNDVLQNFMRLGSDLGSLGRTQELLRPPNDPGFMNRLKFKSDEDFRLMVNLTIGRIYLYMLKIIEIYRITDKYSVRCHLVSALVVKIMEALNKIPRNLNGIFYSHSSFMNVIFKYQIEDTLSNEANSIFQVHNVEPSTAPLRLSIHLSTEKATDSNKGKVAKSSYPFHVYQVENILKEILQKNQYYYVSSKINLYQNTCDLDQFDQELENIKKRAKKRLTKIKQDQNNSQFPKSRQVVSAYQSLKNVFYNTSRSSSKFRIPPLSENKSQMNRSDGQEQENDKSIMKNGTYLIYFDNIRKQYKNPFNKSMKSGEKSSLAYASRVIENLNVFILKRMDMYDSFSIGSCASTNFTLTIFLSLCFILGMLGILCFDNYLFRCVVISIASLGFLSASIYGWSEEIDSEESVREEIQREARRMFKHEPFECTFESGKYHMKLVHAGELSGEMMCDDLTTVE